MMKQMFLLVVPLKSVQHGDSDHLMHKKHHKKRFRGNSMALSTTHIQARTRTHTHTAVFMHHVLPHFFFFLNWGRLKFIVETWMCHYYHNHHSNYIRKLKNLVTFLLSLPFDIFFSSLMVGCRTCINPAASIISQAREVVVFCLLFFS